MTKKLIILAAITLALATNAVRAQEFLPYEGKNAVREGDGGTKRVINSIDFWADGAPPQQFKLLGYVTDRRHRSGIIGKISMSSLDSDIAKIAKENGGDAVILVLSDVETVGTVGNSFGGARGTASTFNGRTTATGSGWSSGISSAVQKNNSKYAVVKYVPKEVLPGESQPATRHEPTPAQAKPDSLQSDATIQHKDI